MNRLCIGISKLTPGWKSLLDQLGVWYEELQQNQNLEIQYSSIIVNEIPDSRLNKKLNVFLSSNGTLLIPKTAKSVRFFYEKDLELCPYLPAGFQELVQFSSIGAGFVCDLQFNPDEHIANNHFSRQRFYFKNQMHPDELVSTTNKEELLDTLEICLRHLHFYRKLPFIQKWNSPSPQPIFGFRVDSDWGTPESIKELYKLGHDYAIPMTWFLHVQAHEDWLEVFHDFKDHEIALHGYEHGTSTSYEHVINNIERGKQLLVHAGLTPRGYCTPYGIWNKTLAEVLQTFDFEYSSEFTVGYNTLPFYPVHEEELHPTLQIPIHPICTGSLNRKGTSLEEMEEYFYGILEQRVGAYKNTIFYHHPLQPGLDVWNSIFDRVNNLSLTKLTFLEYSQFWKKRLASSFDPVFDLETGQLHCSSSDSDLYIKISLNEDSFYVIKAEQVNQPLTAFEEFVPTPIPNLTEFEQAELSIDPLVLLKTSLLDWKNRKRL